MKKFNHYAAMCSIPQISYITDERMAKLQTIYQRFTPDEVTKVMQKASSSDFLNRRGRKKNFQATFDWMFEPANFLRILEGNF